MAMGYPDCVKPLSTFVVPIDAATTPHRECLWEQPTPPPTHLYVTSHLLVPRSQTAEFESPV